MAKGKGSRSKSSKKSKATAKKTAKKGNTGKQSSKSKAPRGKRAFIQNAQKKSQKQTTHKGTGAKVTSRTSTSNVVVGEKTRLAQQELSNKFGIVTFDTKGKISTTPSKESGGFSDINVGFGSFANAEVFRQGAIDFQVQKFAKENPQANENTAINVFDPLTPTRSFKGTVETTGESILAKVSDFVSENPIIVAVGAILVVGMFAMKGGRRR